MLLTRSPLEYPRRGLSARLACVKHAASVRPEPGSNSPTKTSLKNRPGNKQHCQRNQPQQSKNCTGATKTNLALAFYSTLLSSQRTNTHRCRPQRGLASGATGPAYLTGIGLVKLFVLPCALLTVPPVLAHTAEAVIVRFRGIRQDRPAPLLVAAQPARLLSRPMYSTRSTSWFQIRCRTTSATLRCRVDYLGSPYAHR